MDVDDYVFVINPEETCFGKKGIIRAVQTNFDGRITDYTVSGTRGMYRDYAPVDLQYTHKYSRKFTSQMQLL
jgi:hypothetical protein